MSVQVALCEVTLRQVMKYTVNTDDDLGEGTKVGSRPNPDHHMNPILPAGKAGCIRKPPVIASSFEARQLRQILHCH